MKIHLNRAGQPLGQFTPVEVRAGFKDGKFTGTDLAWRDGMPMWKPLAEVIDEIAPDEVVAIEAGVVTPPLPTVAEAFPWEQRAERGFLAALLETIRMVLLEPTKAFQAMPKVGGLGAPLFYVVLLGGLTLLVWAISQQFLSRMSPPPNPSPEQQQVWAFFQSPLFLGAVALLGPIYIAVVAFFTSALTHLCLILVGGARRPFETTFRVIAYASGSTAVLMLLPLCGPYLIEPVWKFVISVIGLSKAHEITSSKALFAMALPFLLCCVVPALMLIFIFLVAMGVKLGAA